MADVTPRVAADALILQSYTAEGFTVGGKFHKGAVLIAGGKLLALEVAKPAELTYRHVASLKGQGLNYLVLGCGPKTLLPPLDFVGELKSYGIVAEAMSTAAACRTYNVLLGEGRAVAALLIPG